MNPRNDEKFLSIYSCLNVFSNTASPFFKTYDFKFSFTSIVNALKWHQHKTAFETEGNHNNYQTFLRINNKDNNFKCLSEKNITINIIKSFINTKIKN